MGIFKDVLNHIEEEKIQKSQDEHGISDGVSFLDKNLTRVTLSTTEDSLFKMTIMTRGNSKYIMTDVVFDKDHLSFLGKAMSEFYKNGNLDKLKKQVEKF